MEESQTGRAALPEDSRVYRGRPRSAHCHENILDAVLALLAKEGYGAVTIEGVARHAGVGKQTIYRWWRSRAELVLEAFANHAANKIPVPNTGSLKRDLEIFLNATFVRLTETSGPIARGLIADAALDPEFNEVMRTVFVAKRRKAMRDILERAVRRGELSKRTELELMIDVLFGPMWYRLLNLHGPLDAAFAKKLVKSVLHGFSPAASL
jgi:AcrR family transcriptional regulator